MSTSIFADVSNNRLNPHQLTILKKMSNLIYNRKLKYSKRSVFSISFSLFIMYRKKIELAILLLPKKAVLFALSARLVPKMYHLFDSLAFFYARCFVNWEWALPFQHLSLFHFTLKKDILSIKGDCECSIVVLGVFWLYRDSWLFIDKIPKIYNHLLSIMENS